MLPFNSEVLASLHAQFASTSWPAPLIAWILAIALLLLVLKPTRSGGRLIAGFLAVAWVWVGVIFHYQLFATLNFLGPAYAGLFGLQALLLLGLGVIGKGPGFVFRSDPAGLYGLTLILLVLAASLSAFLGGPANALWAAGPLSPALLPLLTLGLLLLSERRPLLLAILPLLWLMISAATGWVLGRPQDLLAPLLGLIAVFALLVARIGSGRRRGERDQAST